MPADKPELDIELEKLIRREYGYELEERFCILMESGDYHYSHALNKAKKEIRERMKQS